MPESLNELLSMAPALTLIVGIALLLGGGHWLVDGSVRIARRLGVSTLLIGLTIVAFGTSSPELAFNITAVLSGSSDLSFGNVVGSNIANIGLVVGAVALFRSLRVSSRVVRKELPLLLAVSLGMVFLAWAPFSRPAVEGGARIYAFSRIDGVLLVLAMTACSWGWFRLARRDKRDPLVAEALAEAAAEPSSPLPVAIMLFGVGLGLLIIGGKLTQVGAVDLARTLGATEAIIGLTIVAVATSLPELVASAVAARKGHSDLAIGNVVGSNLFNILLVLGATAIVAPVTVPADDGWMDLMVMVAFTAALLPISLTKQGEVTRWEGALLLAAYVGYLGFRVMRAAG